MKSPWIVICRLPVAGTTGPPALETWSSSGRGSTAGSSQAVPEIGSSGRSSWVGQARPASAGVVAVSRFGL